MNPVSEYFPETTAFLRHAINFLSGPTSYSAFNCKVTAVDELIESHPEIARRIEHVLSITMQLPKSDKTAVKAIAILVGCGAALGIPLDKFCCTAETIALRARTESLEDLHRALTLSASRLRGTVRQLESKISRQKNVITRMERERSEPVGSIVDRCDEFIL